MGSRLMRGESTANTHLWVIAANSPLIRPAATFPQGGKAFQGTTHKKSRARFLTDSALYVINLLPQRHGMVGWGVLVLVLQRGGDEALEQRVGAVRAALELGVELGTQVEVTARNLDSLD